MPFSGNLAEEVYQLQDRTTGEIVAQYQRGPFTAPEVIWEFRWNGEGFVMHDTVHFPIRYHPGAFRLYKLTLFDGGCKEIQFHAPKILNK